MKHSKQKLIQGAVFRAVIRFFSWFSLRWNHRLGAVVGWLLWRVPNRNKKITEKNIAIAFSELVSIQQQRLVKLSLVETGKTFTELGPLWLWPLDKRLGLIQSVKGAELLSSAFDKGKGAMVLSPHIGCWEIIGPYLASRYPTSILYRPPRIGSIDDFMRTVRESTGATLVPTDLTGVKALRRALKNNQVIGILPDQDPGKNGGVIAPFFGHPANTMVLVSKLAAKAECPILVSYAERLPNGAGYVIHIKAADSTLSSLDEFEAASALNREVEACARALPEQYQWAYNRFKYINKS